MSALHTVRIPTALLFARESRESRKKHLLNARNCELNSSSRKGYLDISAMYKRHEKSWMKMYQEEM